MKTPAFIIAEAGVNHNGDMALARGLVDAAAEAGADAVKFQSFRAADLASGSAAKADYQARTTGADGGQLEMLRRLELSVADHEMLIAHAKARGIAFMSSPFDAASLELLTGRFGLETIKCASGELTNAPFLLAIARAARRVIVSTGMSDLADVERALGVLAFGFVAASDALPRRGDFAAAYASDAGQRALRDRVTLLHCTTEYPAPPAEVNLRAMDALAHGFGLPVGYSDHTRGIHISLAAVARGACMIEKHFTLDRALPGPDHAASLAPHELTELVAQIREIEQALGDGIKRATASEWRNRDVARKSLVAAAAIEAGEPFTERNLTCKRPGSGASPSRYWELLGTPATRRYAADELIDG